MSWPSQIVIVRHAESEGNLKPSNDASFRNKANHNFSLTDKGRKQAKITGDYLKAKYGRFDAYICSTFNRTQETLSVMYPGIIPVIDSRLDEMWRGIWHTMTEEEVTKYYPEERRIWDREGWYHYRAPGGQSGQDVELIIYSFLYHLREFFGGKRILVVGHGTWMIFLWRIIFNHSVAEAEAKYKNDKYKNASVTVLESEDGLSMRLSLDNYAPQVDPPKVARRMKRWYEHDGWVTPEEVQKVANELSNFMTTGTWSKLLESLKSTRMKIRIYVWDDRCNDYEAMYLTGDGFVDHHGRLCEDLIEIVENFMTHDFYGARDQGGNWAMKRHPNKLIPWLELQYKYATLQG